VGHLLAAADWDNNIRIWQVKDGALLQTLSSHQDGVTSLSLSSGGRVLASLINGRNRSDGVADSE
jgi:WD40 repeat protein